MADRYPEPGEARPERAVERAERVLDEVREAVVGAASPATGAGCAGCLGVVGVRRLGGWLAMVIVPSRRQVPMECVCYLGT